MRLAERARLRRLARLGRLMLAAWIATLLLIVLIGFQLALALGAPLGDLAWGGQNPGVLPTRLRVASAVTGLVIYPLIVLVILASAGVIPRTSSPVSGPVVMWVLTGLFLLGALANAVSRSPRERIWAPVSLVVGLCCAAIAVSP